ncbi:TniQ family protein [Roseibium sp. RKSG952]|uniref:TniQ family protein n=1 Tax=Roseibium sp. RKSG952 TaxID=2529384 RepID=UPI0012BBDD20|nr:TniQ family protein [Roseibium sp. RKSG952]MTI02108.1 hypothetical protein [Roseibium sp. RKSG952]
MITVLPLKTSALADEPGFSLLARNTAINASGTTQEFCTATGLSKAKVCTGRQTELDRLADLTASERSSLTQNSPEQLSRTYSRLHGQQFLTRSLRKQDLAICPVCWLETGTSDKSQLHLRRNWLPRPIQTCPIHNVALIPLPYADYTSCYDHILRARFERGWLDQLPRYVLPMRQSPFERAAICQIDSDTPMCNWIGDVQIDVVERWCLGLGQFVKMGTGHPADLTREQQRNAINAGFAITEQGASSVFEAVDKALCKHRLRLSKTWLHNWALLSVKPKERSFFRELMRQLCADQGHFCLNSISQKVSVERYVDANIVAIAKAANRHHSWVRMALVRDGLLPEGGNPQQQNLKVQMQKCLAHIQDLVKSLDTTKGAKLLGIGTKGFEALVNDGLLRPIRSTAHKKWRFRREDIEGFSARIQEHVAGNSPTDNADYCSIHQACFAYGCTTPQVIRLILTDQLAGSYQHETEVGISGIRVLRSALVAKLPIFTSEHITPYDLTKQLGLEYAELKQLNKLNLLPCYPTPSGCRRRIRNSVSVIILDQFLGRFQTVRSAASVLQIEESDLQKRINEVGIYPSPDAGGLPVYPASELLSL